MIQTIQMEKQEKQKMNRELVTSLTVKWPVLVGYTKANDSKASLLLASGATSFT